MFYFEGPEGANETLGVGGFNSYVSPGDCTQHTSLSSKQHPGVSIQDTSIGG